MFLFSGIRFLHQEICIFAFLKNNKMFQNYVIHLYLYYNYVNVIMFVLKYFKLIDIYFSGIKRYCYLSYCTHHELFKGICKSKIN